MKYTCPICLEAILDSTQRKPGQDAIYCDGQCQTWIHRRCAGLSKLAFTNLCESSCKNPFYCPNCRLEQQSLEISSLKSAISKLISDLADLKHCVSSDPCSRSSLEASLHSAEGSSNDTSLSYSRVVAMGSPSTPEVKNPAMQATTPSVSPTGANTKADDRKFNLVVYGIKECEKGVARMKRLLSDIESVCSSLKVISPSFDQHHIKDCFRLGKYSQSLKRPRPLLVKLNCVIDVADILSKRTSLPPSCKVYIKPHLSPSERKQEIILLKERRLLVDAGIDRKSIKLHGDKLYVNKQIQGQVLDGMFVKCTTASSQASTTTLESGQLSSANSHSALRNDSSASVASAVPGNPSPSK